MSLDFELTEEHLLVQQSVREAMRPWLERKADLREMSKRCEFPHESGRTSRRWAYSDV